MKPLSLKEILPFAQYDILRPRLRPLIIAEKNRRRLGVGAGHARMGRYGVAAPPHAHASMPGMVMP